METLWEGTVSAEFWANRYSTIYTWKLGEITVHALHNACFLKIQKIIP